MEPSQLEAVGHALFGPRWITPHLAEALNVSERTVRRWLDGAVEIPSGVSVELWDKMAERVTALTSLMDQMR